MVSPAIAVGTDLLVAVAAGSVLILVLIVVAPWRRVRDEPPLDPDETTRLLLPDDPDAPGGSRAEGA